MSWRDWTPREFVRKYVEKYLEDGHDSSDGNTPDYRSVKQARDWATIALLDVVEDMYVELTKIRILLEQQAQK